MFQLLKTGLTHSQLAKTKIDPQFSDKNAEITESQGSRHHSVMTWGKKNMKLVQVSTRNECQKINSLHAFKQKNQQNKTTKSLQRVNVIRDFN